MKLNKPLVIFLMGPTACGKSSLAIQLKKLLPIELISVDSALIYRGMDIGTAKPSNIVLLKYPHFLINIRDPLDVYSVGDFYEDVLKIIKSIISLNKIPLLVGGTMFYFKILLDGLSQLPSSNVQIRNNLLKTAKINGNVFLHNQLKSIDYISANRIHYNDLQRVIRALEVFLISGKTLTQLIQCNTIKFPYTLIQFSIMPISKDWLYEKITKRFNKMLLLGFENEVKNLLARKNLHSDLPAMKCIGYSQMWNYLKNKISYKEMVDQTIRSTKKLVKHQLTWLKNWKNTNVLISNNNVKELSQKVINTLGTVIKK